MKNCLAALLVIYVSVTLCYASAKCRCDPLAGCRRMGCKCLKDTVVFQPPLIPAQAPRPSTCADCPKITCPADVMHFSCYPNQPCSEEQLKTYVEVKYVEVGSANVAGNTVIPDNAVTSESPAISEINEVTAQVVLTTANQYLY